MMVQENDVDVIKKAVRKVSGKLNALKKAIYIRLSYEHGEWLSSVLTNYVDSTKVEIAVFPKGRPDSRLFLKGEIIVSTSYETIIYNYDFGIDERIGRQYICKSFMKKDEYDEKYEYLTNSLSYFKSLLNDGGETE